MLPVLIPAAILGIIVFGLVSLRGRGGADLAPHGWLGLYLYLASLAGVLVFVIGVASLVNVAFAATAGNDFTYGHPPDISAFTPPAPDQFSGGIADTLGGGIAALPVWLIYLRLVVRELRAPETAGSAA
jgi:hypothetical protein